MDLNKKRRSSLRRVVSKEDDETTRSAIKRRISFSGKKFVREFDNTEKPKDYEHSYELSDHTNGEDSSGQSQSTTTSSRVIVAERTFQRPLVNDFNKENVPLAGAITSSYYDITENDLTLQLQTSMSLTLLPQELHKKGKSSMNITNASAESFSQSALGFANQHDRLYGLQDMDKTIDLMPKPMATAQLAEYMIEHTNRNQERCMELTMMNKKRLTASKSICQDKSMDITLQNNVSLAQDAAVEARVTDSFMDITPLGLALDAEPQTQAAAAEPSFMDLEECKASQQLAREMRELCAQPQATLTGKEQECRKLQRKTIVMQADMSTVEQPKSRTERKTLIFDDAELDISQNVAQQEEITATMTNAQKTTAQQRRGDITQGPEIMSLTCTATVPKVKNTTATERLPHDQEIKTLTVAANNTFDWDDDNAMNSLADGSMLSSPLIPMDVIEANCIKKKLNFRQLNDEIESGRIQVFPNGPKTPTTDRKAKLQRFWQGIAEPKELDMKLVQLIRPRGPLNFNDGKSMVMPPKVATVVDAVVPLEKKPNYRFSQADEMLLDNTNFLIHAKLGNETVSRNSSKSSTHRETMHNNTDLETLAMHMDEECLSPCQDFSVPGKASEEHNRPRHTVYMSESIKCEPSMHISDVMEEEGASDHYNDFSVEGKAMELGKKSRRTIVMSESIEAESMSVAMNEESFNHVNTNVDEDNAKLLEVTPKVKNKPLLFKYSPYTPARSIIEFENLEEECKSAKKELPSANVAPLAKRRITMLQHIDISAIETCNGSFETPTSSKNAVANRQAILKYETIDISGIEVPHDSLERQPASRQRPTVYELENIEPAVVQQTCKIEATQLPVRRQRLSVYQAVDMELDTSTFGTPNDCDDDVANTKRLHIQLTPNLPMPKKRHTRLFANCAMEDVEVFEDSLMENYENTQLNISNQVRRNAKNKSRIPILNKPLNYNTPIRKDQRSPKQQELLVEQQTHDSLSGIGEQDYSVQMPRKKAHLISNIEVDESLELKPSVALVQQQDSLKSSDEQDYSLQMPKRKAHLISNIEADESLELKPSVALVRPVTFECNPITVSDVSSRSDGARNSLPDEQFQNIATQSRSSNEHGFMSIATANKNVINLSSDTTIFAAIDSMSSSEIDNVRLSLVESLLDADVEQAQHKKAEHQQPEDANAQNEQLPDLDVVEISEQMQVVDIIDICEQSQDLEIVDICEQSQASTNADASASVNACQKCKRCKYSLNTSGMQSINKTLDLSNWREFSGLAELQRLRQAPTPWDVHKYWRLKSLERQSIGASETIAEAQLENNPLLDWLKEEYKKCKERLGSTNAPIQRPFHSRLETLMCAQAPNWIFDYQMQCTRTYIFSHTQIATFRLIVKYEPLDALETAIKVRSIKADSSRSPVSTWSVYEHFQDFQLQLKMPLNLNDVLEASDEYALLNFLARIDALCLEVRKTRQELCKATLAVEARLIREVNRTVVRKIVRNIVKKDGQDFIRVEKIEFVVEIGNIYEVSFKDILRPPLYYFNEDIQFLPKGIQFLKTFLEDPVKYLKQTK